MSLNFKIIAREEIPARKSRYQADAESILATLQSDETTGVSFPATEEFFKGFKVAMRRVARLSGLSASVTFDAKNKTGYVETLKKREGTRKPGPKAGAKRGRKPRVAE